MRGQMVGSTPRNTLPRAFVAGFVVLTGILMLALLLQRNAVDVATEASVSLPAQHVPAPETAPSQPAPQPALSLAVEEDAGFRDIGFVFERRAPIKYAALAPFPFSGYALPGLPSERVVPFAVGRSGLSGPETRALEYLFDLDDTRASAASNYREISYNETRRMTVAGQVLAVHPEEGPLCGGNTVVVSFDLTLGSHQERPFGESVFAEGSPPASRPMCIFGTRAVVAHAAQGFFAVLCRVPPADPHATSSIVAVRVATPSLDQAEQLAGNGMSIFASRAFYAYELVDPQAAGVLNGTADLAGGVRAALNELTVTGSRWEQSPRLRGPFKMVVVTQSKNFGDKRAILPWIYTWLLSGCEHIVIYDHISDDEGEALLRPFVRRGVLTLIPWRVQHRSLHGSMSDAAQRLRHVTEWWLFVDTDEYLFPTQARQGFIPRPLLEVLRDARAATPGCDVVRLPWHSFCGTMLVRPIGGLDFEVYTMAHPGTRIFKCAVHAAEAIGSNIFSHEFVTESSVRCSLNESVYRLAHYSVGAKDMYQRKWAMGRVDYSGGAGTYPPWEDSVAGCDMRFEGVRDLWSTPVRELMRRPVSYTLWILGLAPLNVWGAVGE